MSAPDRCDRCQHDRHGRVVESCDACLKLAIAKSAAETIPYRPSNGTEGEAFEAKFCGRCEYDRLARESEVESGCEILGRSMAFSINEPGYPEEWISDPDHSNPRCTRFRLEGTGTHEQAAADLARYHAAMAEMKASQR